VLNSRDSRELVSEGSTHYDVIPQFQVTLNGSPALYGGGFAYPEIAGANFGQSAGRGIRLLSINSLLRSGKKFARILTDCQSKKGAKWRDT